jgi:RHS repeat-associated protein
MKGSDTDYTLLQSTMTPDRNHTASVTDTNGSQTSYTYNASTEQLTGTSTYNPETGKTISTNRVYNASNGRQTQMYIDGALSMSYAYKNGGLSSLTRKSYRNGIGQWQSYGLVKDVWGNTSAVTVSASTNGSTYSGTRTLASYTYAANNGNLTGMTCGNGDSISYSYDSFDRLIKTRYNDTGDELLYTYNAEGSLAQLELRRNSTTVGIFSYEYDSLGRLIRSRQTDGTNTIQRTEHLYDAANRLKQQNYTVGNKSFTTNYTYSSTDGLLTSMKTAQGATIGYTYDGLKRQKKTTVTSGGSTVLTTKYAYRTVSGKQTSTQPEYYKVIKGNGDGTSTATILEGAKYSYDAAGNITMISESISPFRKLVEYQYDKQNQLVSAKYYTYSGTSTTASSTTTYTYAYDTAGNLLTEKKNGTTVKTYTYGDSGWNDLLTSFRHGGKTYSISYDGSGNPTSYPRWQDNTSYYMSWSNGRQLTYMDYATTASNETQIRYAYDANGIRNSKKVNNTVHSYVTQSGKVIRETIGSGSSATILDFIYDNQGLPFALNYSTNNGSSFTTYYYVLNLQGDVVKLVDGGGTSVASYAYDAWGDILSSSGSKAEINPLRYRGYYYDTETGFYYLQSRYYDPVTHRFINADSYSSTGQGIIGYNMFAYCNNSPVIQADHTGEFGLLTLVSAAVSAAVNVATTYIAAKATGQEYTLTDALVSAAIGAVNAIPGAGPFIAGGISGAYSAYTAVKNGATAGEAALCFAVSATATTASIGNLANLGTESALRIAATASADLVFGTGYNCIAATTNKAVSVKSEERKASGTQTTSTTRSRNTQKRGNKRTGYTMCLY